MDIGMEEQASETAARQRASRRAPCDDAAASPLGPARVLLLLLLLLPVPHRPPPPPPPRPPRLVSRHPPARQQGQKTANKLAGLAAQSGQLGRCRRQSEMRGTDPRESHRTTVSACWSFVVDRGPPTEARERVGVAYIAGGQFTNGGRWARRSFRGGRAGPSGPKAPLPTTQCAPLSPPLSLPREHQPNCGEPRARRRPSDWHLGLLAQRPLPGISDQGQGRALGVVVGVGLAVLLSTRSEHTERTTHTAPSAGGLCGPLSSPLLL